MSDDLAVKVQAKALEAGLPPADAGGIPDGPVQDMVVGEDGRELPYVEIRPQLSAMAREIGGILAQNGVFVRQRQAMTVGKDGRLVEMTARRFQTYCDEHMVTYKWEVPKPQVYVRKAQTISAEYAATILQADQFIGRQRELVRVATVRQPVLRPDGKLELLPYGYDAQAMTMTIDTGVDYRTDLPLSDAVAQLRGLLGEFPLGDRKPNGQSRNEAIIVTAMLAMYGTPLQKASGRRMNYMITSNSVGSGKTLIGQIGIITTMGSCDVQPVPETEENWRKILDTETLAGSPYILFDDINGFFRSQILNAYLTAPSWTGRRMHTQQKFVVPKQAVVFLTGNNLEVSPDVSRRFLHCKMVVDEADPQARKIEHVISDEWLERPEIRAQLLACLYAIVREWYAAGRPRPSRTVRGYEQWCNIFAGMVEWAGFGDPLEPLPVEESGNSELADMVALLEELAIGVQDVQEYTFGTIVEAARARNCFQWLLDGKEVSEGKDLPARFVLTPKANSRFGKLLSEAYGGKKFTLEDGRRVMWDERGKKRGKTYILRVL